MVFLAPLWMFGTVSTANIESVNMQAEHCSHFLTWARVYNRAHEVFIFICRHRLKELASLFRFMTHILNPAQPVGTYVFFFVAQVYYPQLSRIPKRHHLNFFPKSLVLQCSLTLGCPKGRVRQFLHLVNIRYGLLWGSI